MTSSDLISLAHGNGGRYTRELVAQVFAAQFDEARLDLQADAARVPGLPPGQALVMTTDSFTVQPLEFPGGDIGSLAVHGTINDLAVAGATPLCLTLNVIIEEGFEITQLERIAVSLAAAAREARVSVIAGDTKVVPRGHGGGLYLATTGLGARSGWAPDFQTIRDGDALLVSGPVGDHGISVLLAREDFDLQSEVRSDSAPVAALCDAAMRIPGLRFMRDPTRGGLATVCHELAAASGMGVRLDEARVPIRDSVAGVCEMLGYDPHYLACEGRVVAVCEANDAAALLESWRALPEGRDSAVAGRIDATRSDVVMQTRAGGERLMMELEADPLPRIC